MIRNCLEISIFINKIKEQYPNLNIGVDYDKDEDVHYIWHTDAKLQFENNDFLKFIGSLMREYLFSNGIYNFSFGYDHMKAKEESKCQNI